MILGDTPSLRRRSEQAVCPSKIFLCGGISFGGRGIRRVAERTVWQARMLRRRDGAELGLRENIEQHPLTLFPYAEHPAGRLHVALAQSVNAYVERDGPFDRFDNVAERNGFGRAGQLIAAARSAARIDEATAHQIADDLFEIILGDAFLLGDLIAARAGMIGEMNHGPQCVFNLAGNLHQAHGASPASVRTASRALAVARLRPPFNRSPKLSPRMRSTYLTSISLSTLTRSPGRLKPRVVILSVCGMSATVKRRLRILKTVRLMPSRVTEPFSTR